MAIGPHEDCELQLMLAGTKPLTRFVNEPAAGFYVDDSAFLPHVAAGTLRQFIIPNTTGTETRYYCLPTEEWRVKVMEHLNALWQHPGHGGFTQEDMGRIEGTLLGYTKTDIEHFIAHSKAKA